MPEKLGCINNAKQKKLLAAAGHQVIAKNLLTKHWQPERLRAFFGGLPVREWFNLSAPAIKHGDVDPEKQTEQDAIALMLENPFLIRRPLMQVDDSLMVGFDQAAVANWIGLKEVTDTTDMETCPKTLAQATCSLE
jgi:nitrogenase-associated protein